MFALRRIGRRTLDLELRTSRDVTVRVLERPGLWMEPEARTELLAELRALTAKGVRGDALEYGLLAGSDEGWRRAILTLVRENGTGRLIGFNAMPLLDVRVGGRQREVLHLGLLLLDPAWRGRGFSRMLYEVSVALVLVRRAGRPFWVSSVSQVPAIVGMVADTLEATFPLGAQAPSEAHRQVATQLMAHHRAAFGVGPEARFDPATFVIENAYTGGSVGLKKAFAEAPKHRDPRINAVCSARLDYDRGDDFLQVGRFTPRVAWACLSAWVAQCSVLAPLLGARSGLRGSHA